MVTRSKAGADLKTVFATATFMKMWLRTFTPFLIAAFVALTAATHWNVYHSNTDMHSILSAVHKRCHNITYFYHLTENNNELTKNRNKLLVLAFGDPAGHHKLG